MATFNGHFEDSNGNMVFPIPSGACNNIETTNIASQQYTKGSFLYFQDVFCRTTQTIAQNDTLEIGVNLQQTVIGTELSSHLVASNGTEFSFQTLVDGGYN